MFRRLSAVAKVMVLSAALLVGGGTTGIAHAEVGPTIPAPVIAAVSSCDTTTTMMHCIINVERFHHPEDIVKTEIYIVRHGDTLSHIAKNHHVHWEQLYCTNLKVIGSNPDIIKRHQKLILYPLVEPKRCRIRLLRAADSSPPNLAVVFSSSTSGWTSNYSKAVANFRSCVISAESGGNSQVMNASGHYGLYQFSYSTWVAYGGNGSDFGHASVAEQNQVFNKAMATPAGAGNWTPYDGCVLEYN